MRRRILLAQVAALFPWSVLVVGPVLGIVRGEPSTAALAGLAWVGPWFVGDARRGLGLFTALLLVARPSISPRAVDVAGLWPWLVVLALVTLGRWGRSFRGPLPRDAASFHASGTPVTSPCTGRVVLAVDGAPPWPAPGVHPAGDPVVAGDPVGRVGCTGRSTEPHLHVHAARGDRPVPMRFDAVEGGYRRGSVLRVRPPAA